jgi:signal transduction histidine kinase
MEGAIFARYDPAVMRAPGEEARPDLLRSRLRAGILVWMGGAAIFVVSPLWLGPLKEPLLWRVQLGHLGSVLAYLLLLRLRTPAQLENLARGVVLWVSILLAVIASLTAEPEAAMIMCCTLALATATLLPWHLASQFFTVVVAGLSMALALAWRNQNIATVVSESMLGVYASLGASLFIARVLRLHRLEAERIAWALREEARISNDMARVGRELIAVSEEPTLLARLAELTTEVFECDVSYTLLRDKDGKLVAREGYGYDEEEWAAVARYMRELDGDATDGFLSYLDEHGVAERVFTAEDPLPTASRTRPGSVSMGIYFVLRKAGEVVGFQAAGFRGRAHRMTSLEARLARGMSHLASLALQTSRLLTELETANRFQAEFLANMSHELRTPLNVILGYNEMLTDGALGPLNDEQIATLKRVSRTAEGQLALVTATLELSSLEADGVRREVSTVDLRELITEMASEVAVIANDAGLRFAWDTADDLPIIRGDMVKLKMIVKNLVENAIKYTERGWVRVRVGSREPGWVAIEVEDTGSGIPAEAMDLIFEAFRQHNRDRGGVGLGLHIVRRLTAALGGEVSVESELGRGTKFTVRIPCEEIARGEPQRASA